MPLDYLTHVERESARFADALRSAAPDARVPSCPGWTADDLLYHLAEVYASWTKIARDQLDEEEASARKPPRPDDRGELFGLFAECTSELLDVLRNADLDAPMWTWTTSPDFEDHSVRFLPRRMAHEALIHRLDAELTAGTVTGVDADLAVDGVREVIKLFRGYRPEWADFVVDGPAGLLRCTDAGAEVGVRVGHWSGTSPNTGRSYEGEAALELADAGDPTFTISASAADLDAWLWNRPLVGTLEVSGNRDDYDAFAAVVAEPLE